MMTDRPVLFIAPFDDAAHAHSMQRRRALERLGARVTTFDLLAKPSLLERFRAGDQSKRLERVLMECDPELVLVCGTNQLGEEQVDRLRALSRARWITWMTDDMRTVAGAALQARAYDHIYAVGTDVAAEVSERLGRTVDVLSLGADPSVYRPIKTRDQYRANVVFAGTATPHRERLLSELVEFGLALWGPGWRRTALRDYCRGEAPSTEEYVRAYAGASVAINIHHVSTDNGVAEAGCNERLFELASMGVAQVVDDRGDIARSFAIGRELAVFRDGSELRETVRGLLEDPHEAERLGQGARARLLQDHTYMHRLRQLILDQPRPLAGR